jgi:chaperonin GroES
MNIRPLHDRVVVRRADEETKTPGGIVIPDSASKEKPIQGEVIAVGPGKMGDNGQVQAMAVKVGDKVLFGKYAGTEVKLSENEYTVMREDDIMGIIE